MADALTPLMIYLVDAIVLHSVDLKGFCGLASGFVGAVLVIRIVDGNGLKLDDCLAEAMYILLLVATCGVHAIFDTQRKSYDGNHPKGWWAILDSDQ